MWYTLPPWARMVLHSSPPARGSRFKFASTLLHPWLLPLHETEYRAANAWAIGGAKAHTTYAPDSSQLPMMRSDLDLALP